MSWEIKLPPKIRNETRAERAEASFPLERLQKPCLMSGMRNKKMGRERKCLRNVKRVSIDV